MARGPAAGVGQLRLRSGRGAQGPVAPWPRRALRTPARVLARTGEHARLCVLILERPCAGLRASLLVAAGLAAERCGGRGRGGAVVDGRRVELELEDEAADDAVRGDVKGA